MGTLAMQAKVDGIFLPSCACACVCFKTVKNFSIKSGALGWTYSSSIPTYIIDNSTIPNSAANETFFSTKWHRAIANSVGLSVCPGFATLGTFR